jgi:pimeloyl-ACP methyl ester carboxylesterase
MGGAIALSAALSRPDLLSGLVLIGTGARLGVSPSILEVSQVGDMKKLDEMLTDWAYGPLVGLEQIKEWHRQIGLPPALTYFFDFTACSRFDVRERLTAITLPTLVVCGSADRLTPLKYSQYLASGIPNARMVEIPDAGHMVMLERPDLFNAAIAEFCLAISSGNCCGAH